MTTLRREECDHSQITPQGRCVRCGLQFHLQWSATRWGIAVAARRNLGLGLIGVAVLLLWARLAGNNETLQALALGVMVFFLSRVFFNIMELFSPHGFFQGPLKDLHPQGPFSVLAPFRTFMVVGRAKFPVSAAVYRQFTAGETVLVEFLRWSKVPVAVYRTR